MAGGVGLEHDLLEDHLEPYRRHLTARQDAGHRAGAAWAAMNHVPLLQAEAYGWLVVSEAAPRESSRQEHSRILRYAGS